MSLTIIYFPKTVAEDGGALANQFREQGEWASKCSMCERGREKLCTTMSVGQISISGGSYASLALKAITHESFAEMQSNGRRCVREGAVST